MINSTYSPQTWESVQALSVRPNIVGIKITVSPGQTVTTDTKIVDDSLVRGIRLIVNNAMFGDTVTFKIVDVDGVYTPAGTIIQVPVLNYNIAADVQTQSEYQSIAPFKLLGGVYIRVVYASAGGLIANTNVGVDLMLATVLF